MYTCDNCKSSITDKLYAINRAWRIFDKPSKTWEYGDSKSYVTFCKKCSPSLNSVLFNKITSIISSCKNKENPLLFKPKEFKNSTCDCCDRCAKKINTVDTYSAVYSHDVIACENYETEDSSEFLYLCFECEDIKSDVLYEKNKAIIKLKNGFELNVATVGEKYW